MYAISYIIILIVCVSVFSCVAIHMLIIIIYVYSLQVVDNFYLDLYQKYSLEAYKISLTNHTSNN